MRFSPLLGLAAAALLTVCPGPATAQTAKVPSDEILRTILDDDPAPLPRSLAVEEIGLPLPLPLGGEAPPTGQVFTPPEYARNLGILIRWGSFNAILTAMTVAITSGDPTAVVWVIVADAGQQTSASATLSGAGADMSRVEFLVAPTNTVWIRDYGPRFIEEDKALAIVDHVYNRPRPLDDQIPDVVATAWGLAGYDLPLTHGGGNFHLFADGQAFMSDLVLAENPTLDATDVANLFAQYENLELTIFPGFPSSFDSTRHIDMWMLPARDRVAIVGEYDPADGAPYTITEDAVAELALRGYTVLRTPGWCAGCPSFGTHYTYTNAVVLNRVVLVPQYSAYPVENAAAMLTFGVAFPGRQIVGLDADAIVGSAGVFHCIVMHVPDPDWIFEDGFETSDLSLWSESNP